MSNPIRRGKDCPSLDDATAPTIQPLPGEVWNINFPQACKAGHEIYGLRRCVVLGCDMNHAYKLQMVVPLTGFQALHATSPIATILVPSEQNGLEKESTAWAFHLRSCDLRRFSSHAPLGRVTESDLQSLRLALRILLES